MGGWTKNMYPLDISRSYELKPLRAGQIGVARDAGNQLSAFRACPTESQALVWEELPADSQQRAAALHAYCLYLNRFANHADHPPCALTQRQLAQLIAQRAGDLSVRDGSSVYETGFLAVASVLTATQGSSIRQALSQLSLLSLDIGTGIERHAMQLIIYLAETNGRAANLHYLAIEPYARGGIQHACDWLGQFRTPRMLTVLRELASTDSTAQRLIDSLNHSYGRFDALQAV
jgi:hypothetical protein